MVNTFGQPRSGGVKKSGDGIVEGTANNDVIDTGYTGDPEGDVIDGGDALLPGHGPDDDVVDAGAGDDLVEAGAGDDTVYAGSGGDTVDGGDGDDLLIGDANLPGGGAGEPVRESFQWDLAPDPDNGGQIDNGDDLSGGFTQDTGSVEVTYSVVSESAGVETEFTGTDQYVNGIDTGGGAADDESALWSDLNGRDNTATYQLDFSAPVGNVSFRVNDIDGDGVVTIRAFDADGTPVTVEIDGGSQIGETDTDAVPGADTGSGLGGYAQPDSPQYSMLVTIAGPVSSLTIAHSQGGPDASGVSVTDVFFDVLVSDDTGSGDDSLIGGDGDDTLIGEGGSDTLEGGDGSDSVDGGDGDDVIDTGGSPADNLPDRGFPSYDGLPAIPADPDVLNDRDTVDGGAGDDWIATGDDADLIDGGSGNDSINAGLDDDTVDGGSGDDQIVGGEGADSILGGTGDDTIYGGLDPSLPDALNIPDDGATRPADPDVTNGRDTILGGEGSDFIFGQDDDDVISGGAGADLLDGGIDDDSVSGDDGTDILLGGQGNDTLSGGGDTDLVLGGIGEDQITGDGGSDLLAGGDGDDTIDGGTGDDLALGGDGDDHLIGGDGIDLLLGGDGDDRIYGDGTTGEGNTAGGDRDVLLGGDGDDTLVGGDGDDLIDGAAGADVQIGGADRDTFIEVGVGDDIDGSETGDDMDTLVVSSPAIVNYDPADPEAGTIDFYDLATMSVIGTASFRNIENVIFVEDVVNPVAPLSEAPTAPDDPRIVTDVPGAPDARPQATDGVVDGTPGDDVIDLAYDGDPDGDRIDNGDAILPGEGPEDDIVQAGAGDDRVEAGLGNDDVFAGSGDDTVLGETGNDILRGEEGDDELSGGDGNDELSGGVGDDTLDGGAGTDILDAGDGDDVLSGGDGNDFAIGGGGDDELSGGDGSDLLVGGAGNDVFDLGGADGDGDLAFGNDDSDVFVGVGQGDRIDGGETGAVDFDVLDLTGAAEAVNPGGRLEIELSATNPEDGVITFFDADDNETGTTEFFNIERVIPCFTPGTLIATPKGERRVEDLRVGDRIITRDNGIQEIRWLGRRSLSSRELSAAGHFCPVMVRQGALGNGLPERDMLVSPNHRILVSNDKTALYFEEREVLVAAKHLTGLDGVDFAEVDEVTYIHFMFDQHEVVLSDGAWTESFQPGDLSLAGMANSQRNEIFELFPELRTGDGLAAYQAARRSLKKHEARLLTH